MTKITTTDHRCETSMDCAYDKKGLMSPMNYSFASFRSQREVEKDMEVFDTTSIAMSGRGFIFTELKSDKGNQQRPALKKAAAIENLPENFGQGPEQEGAFGFKPFLADLQDGE